MMFDALGGKILREGGRGNEGSGAGADEETHHGRVTPSEMV